MTQEEKQLLLKDICARLSHKVKIKCDGYPNGLVVTGIVGEQVFHTPYFIGGEIIINKHTIDTVRPYLRPMSSMTEEEKKIMRSYGFELIPYDTGYTGFANIESCIDEVSFIFMEEFLNAHHFDYRGLIPIGLALEAPKDMYITNI